MPLNANETNLVYNLTEYKTTKARPQLKPFQVNEAIWKAVVGALSEKEGCSRLSLEHHCSIHSPKHQKWHMGIDFHYNCIL